MDMNFSPLRFKGNFIQGRFELSRSGAFFRSEDPGDLSRPVGDAQGTPAAVSAAVSAARGAFPAWRDLPLARRISTLRRFQKRLLAHRDRLAWVLSRETGKSWTESQDEVTAMATKFDVTCGTALPRVADQRSTLADGSRAVIRYRPRGVVGVIGPFNVPGHLPNGQILPALLTGNTVVFKPSEITPFVGQCFADVMAEADLPAGVFNLVQGGGDVGAALAAHPEVNVLFFTGSAATGARVKTLSDTCPDRLLALELGGKNAALVLADAPLDVAVREILHGAFATSGQRCSSTSRVFLHRKTAQKFLRMFLEKVEALSVGYFTEKPHLGPLVNQQGVTRFLQAQDTASALGFETLKHGQEKSTPRRGHYVSPSVHLWDGFPGKLLSGPRTYWDEELFAPDVAVYVLSSEEDMVGLNNASQYGLVASVFTGSAATFHRLRSRLDNGVVHWNRTTAMTPGVLPFGGTKASGNGWPAGLFVPSACTVPVGSVETPAKKRRVAGGGR